MSEIVYSVAIILVCLRIIYDTHSSTKTLAYLLMVIFVPIAGILVYFTFGINYRKRKLYSKKIIEDVELLQYVRSNIFSTFEQVMREKEPAIQHNKELAVLLLKDSMSPLSSRNAVKLLLNGENKFAEVLAALEQAREHIHIEYYIYEDDEIGNQVKDVLIRKAREGVKVRFIYDDFGSSRVRKHMADELRSAGVEAYPFYRVHFILLANRYNYRNHRKIIVIDGCTGFVGGINVSDRYINKPGRKQVYWRDTHLRIDGSAVYFLQYLFMCDWNFCSDQKLHPETSYFCEPKQEDADTIVQIAASGPDSDTPTILYSIIQAINLAQKEILITTPYFIPGESLLSALVIASLSGVKVKLLVPGVSDSAFVNAAAHSFYDDLLHAGVEIYRYKKGFIHSKTLVSDSKVSMIGTANMDYRSFDLNFEVNAVIYNEVFSRKLRQVFYDDLHNAEQIDPDTWFSRPLIRQLGEKLARLVSPIL